MLADVYRWEGRYLPAVEMLRRLLDANAPKRTAILRRILDLLPRTGKNVKEEYVQRLDEFLQQKDLSDSELVWALDLKTEQLFKEGQFPRAVAILKKTLPRISSPANQMQIEYSLACGQFYEGQLDQAEPTLRGILDRLSVRDELEAKVCLLLGRICLRDERPEEANAFFDQVIEGHAITEYHLAALVGKSEALAGLHRFEDSRRRYHEAFNLLHDLGPNKLVNREYILASVSRTSDGLNKADDLEQALAFGHLQLRYQEQDDNRASQLLLARIAIWHRQLAEKLTKRANQVVSPELAGQIRRGIPEHYRQAADFFLRLSQIPGLLNRNVTQVLWQAALCYEKAGLPAKAQDVLEDFVANWPNDPFLPEALFKLAGMYQVQNRLVKAEEYFVRLVDEFGRTPFGQQSLIPLAECYFAQGPRQYPKAEKILRDIVDDTSKQLQFRPDSQEFRHALFLLGKVYYYQGQFEQCVARLEEALQRYPTDRANPEARFLIAQSYRELSETASAKISQTNDRQLKTTLAVSRQTNLQRAQELYEYAIPAFEKMANRTPLEETYLKLAYMYAADCLYDLNRYDQAVKGYEQVIERYEKTLLALDSYVQIANAYQRLGQWGKIKAVLERMKWLLKQLPDQEFSAAGKPFSRRDWEEWIDWNYRSGLLDRPSAETVAQSPDASPGL
jgi:tetratricopeptide (TPR) repeat protein